MDAAEALRQLKRIPELHEVCHKETKEIFECSRERSDGSTHKVTIELFDAGPELPDSRYRAVATSEDGKQATGNAAPLEVVFLTLHWGDLDQP